MTSRKTHLSAFQQYINNKGTPIQNYQELYDWSVRNKEDFWSFVWDFCHVVGDKKDCHERLDSMHDAQFFVGSQLNFVENLLQGDDDQEALVFMAEHQKRYALSWRKVRRKVAFMQAYLRKKGLKKGDYVAAYLPTTPEAVIAQLAALSLGAVWVCVGYELGAVTLAERFEQIKPKFLFFSLSPLVDTVCDVVSHLEKTLPTLEGIFRLSYAGDIGDIAESCTQGWELVDGEEDCNTLIFPRFPFDHPLYVVFSSGTTGKPKCLVHRAGGVLLQHKKEHTLHCDIHKGDRIFFFSTCSWMMWHWSVSALASKATVCMYDGNPFAQKGSALLNFAKEEKLTFFGASATYYDFIVRRLHDFSLPHVRCAASTGSVLMKEVAQVLNDAIFPSARIYSISGGTDILSCFVIGNTETPIKCDEIQGAGLGMDVAVFDREKKEVRGVKGELVCRSPFPTMPLEFLGDQDGSVFRQSYFHTHPSVWYQGDYALQTETGSFVLYGRSDSLLNLGGVRVGSGEIYALLRHLSYIQESLVTEGSVNDKRRMVLFVVLAEGHTVTDDLRSDIRSYLREKGSVHFVPTYIIQVEALPKTHSGKVSEKSVRQALCNEEGDVSALANPESLSAIKDLWLSTV
ncbi:MAG: acetoacetate--CoA ligase [Alphaproteobacteria bacterium]|nr:acetoacetate--CoA ligase [Alphaproteobacteria bacterium]